MNSRFARWSGATPRDRPHFLQIDAAFAALQAGAEYAVPPD